MSRATIVYLACMDKFDNKYTLPSVESKHASQKALTFSESSV